MVGATGVLERSSGEGGTRRRGLEARCSSRSRSRTEAWKSCDGRRQREEKRARGGCPAWWRYSSLVSWLVPRGTMEEGMLEKEIKEGDAGWFGLKKGGERLGGSGWIPRWEVECCGGRDKLPRI